jgi:hypothetical protein
MMYSVHRYSAAVLALGLALLAPEALLGQQPSELNRLYGQGVNAYFAGRSSEAESNLSQAMALESEDPRIYYFRALSLMRLGRVDEARGDMMVGASKEAQHPQRFAVGKALERVQGGHRLILERYRREARSQQVALKPAQPSQRVLRQAPQSIDRDAHVLRQRIVIPLDRLLGPRSPQPLSAEELSQRARKPLETRTIPPQPTREAAGAVMPTDDPFRDDVSRPSADAAAAAAEPAAEPVIPPQLEAENAAPEEEVTPQAEEMPEAEETPADDENPFGDL